MRAVVKEDINALHALVGKSERSLNIKQEIFSVAVETEFSHQHG